MKTASIFIICLMLLFFFVGCEQEKNTSDAYGNFEAHQEIVVSAEANGQLLQFNIEEGQPLNKGQIIGFIDTIQLHLKKLQLQASVQAITKKTQTATPQIKVFEEQKRVLVIEKNRVEALLKDSAATPKQLDDIIGQIEVIEKQIAATKVNTQTLNRGVLGEIDPIQIQVQQIEDQIKKSYILNPIGGTVLSKFVEQAEFVRIGTPLYKIADLNEMTLRIYISGAQLPQIKLQQKVLVLIDKDESENQGMEGIITWVSEEAEFTPKIVQTKEERVNLVYAVKVKVKNDGRLKIGMPGEVKFNPNQEEIEVSSSSN